jgi:hypothetical protein
MGELISPINITGAAIITQIFLIIIMATCGILLAWGDKYTPTGPSYGPDSNIFILAILILALTTLGALVFSDAFWEIWKPLFGGTIPPVLQWSSSIRIMFTLDVIGVAFLVIRTGGGKVSAFSPIYFTLPALAIFLREPVGRILYYLTITSIAFTLTMSLTSEWTEHVGGKTRTFAYWFVSISCFLLATFIGIITRPK